MFDFTSISPFLSLYKQRNAAVAFITGSRLFEEIVNQCSLKDLEEIRAAFEYASAVVPLNPQQLPATHSFVATIKETINARRASPSDASSPSPHQAVVGGGSDQSAVQPPNDQRSGDPAQA